ncbi:MAG: excisionase family DNA-binding protein [Paracoccaceae bacterium]|nr:excisionase family DNA-binding protein [Paracoccaceae bacterium]
MRILSLRETARRLGISLSTLKRLINAGTIRKIQVTERRVGIVESELDDFVSRRLAERDGPEAA